MLIKANSIANHCFSCKHKKTHSYQFPCVACKIISCDADVDRNMWESKYRLYAKFPMVTDSEREEDVVVPVIRKIRKRGQTSEKI